LLNSIQIANFESISYQTEMDQDTSLKSKELQAKLTMYLTNGVVKEYEKEVNDGLLQFITAASLIQNETISVWNFSNPNTAARDYLFVQNNGLTSLRVVKIDEGVRRNAQQFIRAIYDA
jgi:hypothetical protein